jgi:xylan 1,4-beta-xylosidase
MALIISLLTIGVSCSENTKDNGDVVVDWHDTVGYFPKALWGVNDYEITYAQRVKDPAYIRAMQRLDPALVRIHYGYIADQFTDSSTRSWNEDMIVECFNHAYKAYGDAKIMLNPIAKWPDWLGDKNEVLTPEGEDELVNLFKEFLRITQRNNIRIDYWEILNERENLYHENNQLDKLWSLFNRIVSEMQEIDPDIVIGGPALTYPQEPHFSTFLNNCREDVDFITWHNYASPNPSTETSYILNEAVHVIDSFANKVVDEVQNKDNHHIDEFYLTEFNIQWTWEPFEKRHANHIGALYMALVANELSKYPISGITMWHFKGNAYGLIDKENHFRPAAYLYEWGNNFIYGEKVAINYTDTLVKNDVEVIATVNNHGRAVLLINRSPETTYEVKPNDLGFDLKNHAMVALMDEHHQIPDTVCLTGNDQIIDIPPHAIVLVKDNNMKSLSQIYSEN